MLTPIAYTADQLMSAQFYTIKQSYYDVFTFLHRSVYHRERPIGQ